LSHDESQGSLTLVATPIGNLGDLSARAIKALSEADLWLVEDTRVSGKLASHLGIKKPMRVLNDHSGTFVSERYAEEVKKGLKVAVLTDGGSPAISDPGAILTDICRTQNLEIDSIPGPSAVVNALALSGFFAQRFAFLGFLGRKPGAIRGELRQFANSPLTLVLFESPHRFRNLLSVAAEVLGERRYAICREMTKAHQQVFRDKLPGVPQEGTVPDRGEFTIVIEGIRRGSAEDMEIERCED
jgi:16S rRNA (cytidine1402-2'-O)-methyltransferase